MIHIYFHLVVRGDCLVLTLAEILFVASFAGD